MKRWIACLLAMGMIATLNTALALSKNGEGLYVDANGNVIDESEDEWGTHMPGYYIGEGVAYPIDGDSGSSSVPAPSYSSSGGMTVSSSDGSLNSLPDTAIINPDGSVTLQSGSMQIDAGSDGTGGGRLTEAEYAARLAKANAKLGVTTGVAYIDVNGDPHPATIETLGLGRSTIVVDGTRMLVPTASIVWDTEAPEDKVLAVVTTTKQTYATMRAKKSQKAFVMGHAEKCTVLLVISTGKTWTLIDNQGVRGYVLTSTLTFYDNKPRQYAAGIITVKGKATTKGSTVHVRSSKSNKARQIAEFPVGTPISVFEQDEKWSEVDAGGLHCYILSEFVTLQEPLISVVEHEAPVNTSEPVLKAEANPPEGLALHAAENPGLAPAEPEMIVPEEITDWNY